ncbi:MAG: glycoside hydrolase, partial [Chloroflexi bacterium]|nr:glycoside hydrolase [Chloroflexota bacterium]
ERNADPPARAGTSGDRWTFFGPSGLPVPYRQYFGQGAINGRANTVTFDPAHPGTYYLGSAGGGLWRTTDRGKNWSPLTDQWPFLQVSSIAVAPGGTTLYVGTGDFPYPAPGYSQGLLCSTDAGNTWRPMGPAELQHFAISKVLLDPDNPSIMTVSAGRGRDRWGNIWRSMDAGKHWKAVVQRPAAWCDVECGAPGKGGQRRYYAVGYDAAGMRIVMRSTDRGATWSQVYSAGPVTRPSLAALAVSPTDPLRAYVLLGGIQRVLSTRDGGAHWANITGNLPAEYNWSQDWYDLWLNASSRKDESGASHDVLYAGLIDAEQSLKPGVWRSIGRSYTPESLTHNDQQNSAVDPSDPNHLLVASDGGAYDLRYQPADDTWKWASLNERLGITQFYKSAFHPTNPNVLIAGTQDNSTAACAGDSAKWTNVGGGDGAFCGINAKHFTREPIISGDGTKTRRSGRLASAVRSFRPQE